MRERPRPFAAVLRFICAVAGAAAMSPRIEPAAAQQRAGARSPAPLPCGDVLSFAVRLDRHGFSPGQISDVRTRNFARALAALQTARNIAATGDPDCDTWEALGGDGAQPAITTYVATNADVDEVLDDEIPEQLIDQSGLPVLEYRSPLEKIAERFHTSPALLKKLNPRLSITAGTEIKVPAVQPFDAETRPTPDPQAAESSIEVSRADSALRVTRPDGSLIFFAPVTTGSRYDPLPPGQWKVTSINWRPVFHYNPDLFWDAKPGDWKTTIQAGPNNPVGVVWIGLDLEHYGLHGTPEPGQVGAAASHGCVRLTNWDAARLAALVKPGTPVLFR